MDYRYLRRRAAFRASVQDLMLDDFPLLNVARCPRCHAPMTVRHGRPTPYFQCRCPRGAAEGSQDRVAPNERDVKKR